MTALLTFYAGIVLLAWVEARGDASTIASHIPIDHVQRWVTRCIMSVLMVCAVVGIMGSTWPQVLVMLIGGAFLFSAVFRFMLNRTRNLSPFYIGFSNVYDRVFLRLGNYGWNGNIQLWSLYNGGRLAYITEAIITAASVAAYALL